MSHEWEQYEDRYTLRPETYEAYVDVWTRVPRARSEFTGWAIFSQTANAEPEKRRNHADRVKAAEEIMRAAGYEIGPTTLRGARRWFPQSTTPSPKAPQPSLSDESTGLPVEVPSSTPVEDAPRPAPEPAPDDDLPQLEVSFPPAPFADALIASPTYVTQLDASRRSRLDESRVRDALAALHSQGGVASFAVIGRATAMPTTRVAGFIANLARVLNVDGCSVLSVDRDAQEARLDVRLLRTQFLGHDPG